MSMPVSFENDRLAMKVWPHLGGKVASLRDKADGFELLFNYPAEVPAGPMYDVPYADSWCAGWDECFPARRPGKYVGHPYDNVAVPDRGELWGLPPTSVPTLDGITTVWHGLRFGYRLTRKLFLDGPSVRAHYTLVNLAPFPFRFVWSMNCLLSMAVPTRLMLPEQPMRTQDWTAAGTQASAPFSWPHLPPDLDLSLPDELPARQAWNSIATCPIQTPLDITYPSRRRRLTVSYHSDEQLPAYWGVWISTGGWCGHRQLSAAPTTGRFDELERAIRDDSAGLIAPLGKLTWTIALTVGPTQ